MSWREFQFLLGGSNATGGFWILAADLEGGRIVGISLLVIGLLAIVQAWFSR